MSESPGLPVTVSVLTGIGALTAATLWGQASGDISSTLLIFDIAVGLTGPAAGAIASAAGVNTVYLAGAGGVLLSAFVAIYLMVNKPAS